MAAKVGRVATSKRHREEKAADVSEASMEQEVTATVAASRGNKRGAARYDATLNFGLPMRNTKVHWTRSASTKSTTKNPRTRGRNRTTTGMMQLRGAALNVEAEALTPRGGDSGPQDAV
jgi:hypothetical protein